MLPEPENGDLFVAVFLQWLIGLVAPARFEQLQLDVLADDRDGVGPERFEHFEQLLLVRLRRARIEAAHANRHPRNLRVNQPVLEAQVLGHVQQHRRPQQPAFEMPTRVRARLMHDPLRRQLVERDAHAGLLLGPHPQPPRFVHIADQARIRHRHDVDQLAAVPDQFRDGDAVADRVGEMVEDVVKTFEQGQRGATILRRRLSLAGRVPRFDFPIQPGQRQSPSRLDRRQPRPFLQHLREQLELHLRRAGIGRVQQCQHARGRQPHARIRVKRILAPRSNHPPLVAFRGAV